MSLYYFEGSYFQLIGDFEKYLVLNHIYFERIALKSPF